mgnify:CR=1 FL=1
MSIEVKYSPCMPLTNLQNSVFSSLFCLGVCVELLAPIGHGDTYPTLGG